MNGRCHRLGFSLMEVLIAIFLTTVLTGGIVQLMVGSVSAYRLQLGQGGLEESSHYARDILVSHISQAGYQAEPWSGQPWLPAITSESLNNTTSKGDHLGLQRWSRHDCYGNENPVRDAENQPAFYLLRVRFSVSTAKNLAIRCSYGADASQLQTQINNFGLIEDVESMHVLYAEDTDADNVADHWVIAQSWQHESDIRAIKVAFLLSTRQPFETPRNQPLAMLDETITTPADGHLRKIVSLTSAIRGRIR